MVRRARRDHEVFWILDGEVTFEVGDQVIEASAGDYVFGPREIPHRFTVGERGCRMLFIMVPGGFEDLVRATSEPAPSRTLPPPPEEEPSAEDPERRSGHGGVCPGPLDGGRAGLTLASLLVAVGRSVV